MSDVPLSKINNLQKLGFFARRALHRSKELAVNLRCSKKTATSGHFKHVQRLWVFDARRGVCLGFLRGPCRRRTVPDRPRLILEASAPDALLLKVNVENPESGASDSGGNR